MALCVARDAHAADKDDAALKLHDAAMNEDLLNVEFDKAEKKLKEALKKCGKDGCSPQVLGKLHVAMGTVHGQGGKMDLAKESFVTAIKADPKAELNPDFKTPELEKAFAEAKKEAGPGEDKGDKGDKGEDKGDGEEKPKPKPKPAGGDLTHTPPAEQAVNTPVPIYIEVPEDIEVAKVTLRYKPFGGTKWKSLEMKKVADGFGAEIPCEDVTTTGDVKYYIIAKDGNDDPAGTAGSLKEPHKVPIKNEIEGEEPSLPGKKPPKQCAKPEDCPPGLPGCPDGKAGQPRGDKGWGASCEQTQECQSGFVCLNGSCEEGKDDGGGSGGSSADSGKRKRNAMGLWGQLDLLVINGAEDVCSAQNAGSYACFYQADDPSLGPDEKDRGSQFFGNPAQTGNTNGIQGGFGLGGGRVMLSYDRWLFEKVPLTAGLRLGYAFGGSPASEVGAPTKGDYEKPPTANSFLPFHGEARVAYYPFGGISEPKKFRPFAFLGGGVAQVNASVPVAVCDKADREGGPVVDGSKGTACDGRPDTRERKLDAYQITGLNFVDVGIGATYGITTNVGVALELKAMFMIPTFGFVFAPNIGPVFVF